MRGNSTRTFTDRAALPRDLDGVQAALPAGCGHAVWVPIDALAERAVVLAPAVSVGLDLAIGIAASRVADWIKWVWNDSNSKRMCVLINVLSFCFCSSGWNGSRIYWFLLCTNISKRPTGMSYVSAATLFYIMGKDETSCTFVPERRRVPLSCTSSHFWRYTTFLNRVSLQFHFSVCPLKATSAHLPASKLISGYLNSRILGSILCVRFLLKFHASLYILTHYLK